MDIKLDIYNDECLALANSMYLKFDLHALAIERRFTGQSTITSNRTTWLQYMNLAGLYHSSNAAMTVKSLDTFEDISFDKETLQEHPTTLSRYQEFGKYYTAIIEAFPDNEVLIKGILYGREIDDVIAMEDFHIVGWNANFIDVQEYDLISTLNNYLTIIGTKAGCPNYADMDDLYPTAILSSVVQNLTTLIKRVRFNNSKSYNANTFYIWSHINSVINLDAFKAALTYDDTMYLFKNIARLKSGACSKDVFKEVLGTVVSPKMIDAYYLSSDTKLSSMDLESKSVIADWTLKDVLSASSRATTIDSIVSDHTDRSNYKVADPKGDLTTLLFQDYNENDYSEMTLYDNRENEGDVRELLVNVDYSFLFAATEILTRFYEISLPDTGESITLQHGDWLTIYQRIQQKRFGLLTDTIPPHETTQVYRMRAVSRNELTQGGLTKTDAEKVIAMMGEFPVLRNDTATTTAYTDNYSNTKATITSILDRSINRQNNLYIGALNGIIFQSYMVQLHGNDVNFSDWLSGTGVDVDSMSVDTLTQLEYNILINVVGIDGDSAGSLVAMMGGILQKFVSYKTNISRKQSDTITLPLRLLPTWVARSNDISNIISIVDASPVLITTINSNVADEVNLINTSIDIGISKLSAAPRISAPIPKMTSEIPKNRFAVNVPFIGVEATILEP